MLAGRVREDWLGGFIDLWRCCVVRWARDLLRRMQKIIANSTAMMAQPPRVLPAIMPAFEEVERVELDLELELVGVGPPEMLALVTIPMNGDVDGLDGLGFLVTVVGLLLELV